MTTKQEAAQQISTILTQVYGLLAQAEAIAENGVDFHFNGPGDSYGTGGYYDGDAQEWNSSSSSC